MFSSIPSNFRLKHFVVSLIFFKLLSFVPKAGVCPHCAAAAFHVYRILGTRRLGYCVSWKDRGGACERLPLSPPPPPPSLHHSKLGGCRPRRESYTVFTRQRTAETLLKTARGLTTFIGGAVICRRPVVPWPVFAFSNATRDTATASVHSEANFEHVDTPARAFCAVLVDTPQRN